MNDAIIRNLTLSELEREGLIPEYLKRKVYDLEELEVLEASYCTFLQMIQDIIAICEESPTSAISKEILELIENSPVGLQAIKSSILTYRGNLK